MIKKLGLYINTIRFMKVSQVYYRIRKMFGLKCSIGCKVSNNWNAVKPIKTATELDYDPVFLARFSADEFVNNKITFLHSSKTFCWNEKWHFSDRSPLWNFNLHYFEFLFSLIDAYRKTNNKKYLDKTIEAIHGWINQNPKSNGGEGWSPYTIALRLTNWLSYYATVQMDLNDSFREAFLKSMHEQYEYLSTHLEKDILGNHYFEDLKTLTLCALFFDDEQVLTHTLRIFKAECKEQILGDGMHFELSPMYHKLVFEGVIRVAVALKAKGKEDKELEAYIKPMLNVAWSLEEGLERIPLFNDCGNNVAKSLQGLVKACKIHFNIKPKYCSQFKESGFYIFKQGNYKLIVDAGQPGPAYIPGHAHCDAMSYELFRNGSPILVNCGTYAYQCDKRDYFRSTAAHNTVMIDGVEQSQCWGTFRLAKRSITKVLDVTDNSIKMEMRDQNRNVICRNILIKRNKLIVIDKARGKKLISYIHMIGARENIRTSNKIKNGIKPYAIDYGEEKHTYTIRVKSYKGCICYTYQFVTKR